ncbi:hypothetical protein BGZ63DRAFT_63495 [Mariannaea sp. PMI_226]|nr:hypothetical protein BGZ63DRAFT_63495 [Mariannaea sp. PMI_226]
MSGGSTVERIDAVDAFARTLYIRAKHSGLAFSNVATAVRQLHLALRHLRVEASDPDSLLNNRSHSSSPVYSRQLQPMIEDCDFSLAQLESVLDKYGDGRPSGEEIARDERLTLVRSRLVSDRTNVDMFLDTVQLHNPANMPRQIADNNQPGLEGIKDKVDQIATRLFQKRDCNSISNDDEDGLWREFKSELEKEGFAPQVLHKHKDVLRAYIREMESVGTMSDGTCPTVRGLLERETSGQLAAPRNIAGFDGNDKFFVGIRDGRQVHDTSQAKEVISSSPQDTITLPGESTALISTNDLMAMDSISNDMSALSIQKHQPYGLSPPTQRYLPRSSTGSLPGPELSSSPNSYLLGASPRSIPPLPPNVNGSAVPPYGSSPRTFSRLGPDRYGKEIPPDAQWTKIKRTLVSPEVLQRAGVRYEARPDYVAVLGRLSREEITEYARQSAAARAARSAPQLRRRQDPQRRGRDRSNSKSSRDDNYDSGAVTDGNYSSESESDDGKGTKSYPFIVNPPDRAKASPASTVLPKPILKNKNENHVRFDPEPHEVDPRRDREHRHRNRSPSRDRRRHSGRDEGGGRRRYSDSNGDRYHDRHGEYYGSSRRHHRSDRRGSRRDERDRPRKKGWSEAIGAVGIGGAAAGLLGVLAEAAV